jgi:membrane protease YdiL (CAAX protease family)
VAAVHLKGIVTFLWHKERNILQTIKCHFLKNGPFALLFGMWDFSQVDFNCTVAEHTHTVMLFILVRTVVFVVSSTKTLAQFY